MECIINELCNLKGLQCVITERGKEEASAQLSKTGRGQEGEAERGQGQETQREKASQK